jgi:hypothetical protein
MGFSNLLADGISMGLGDFLSSKAEMEYEEGARKGAPRPRFLPPCRRPHHRLRSSLLPLPPSSPGESKKEKWEFENSREIEEAEQEKQFEEQGMSKEDAAQVTATLAKYPDIFHAIHLQGELGFGPPDKDASPATDGAVSACGAAPPAAAHARRPPPLTAQRPDPPFLFPAAFASFLVFGSVPMISYVVTFYAGYKYRDGVFGIACAFTALTMFLLGVAQAAITKQDRLKTGVLMTLNGSIAAGCAYLVGWGLEVAIGSGVAR